MQGVPQWRKIELNATDLKTCHYHGFLSGYEATSGRNIAFAVPNHDEALSHFNKGFEAGLAHGRCGLDGLIESVLAAKTHLYCADCAAARMYAAGGRTPPQKLDVVSICGPT